MIFDPYVSTHTAATDMHMDYGRVDQLSSSCRYVGAETVTNNVADLQAAIEACIVLLTIVQGGRHMFKYQQCEHQKHYSYKIHTDSKYAFMLMNGNATS